MTKQSGFLVFPRIASSWFDGLTTPRNDTHASCHCEERSDAAIRGNTRKRDRLVIPGLISIRVGLGEAVDAKPGKLQRATFDSLGSQKVVIPAEAGIQGKA